MQFSTKVINLAKLKTELAIIPVYKSNRLGNAATALNQLAKGAIKRALDSGDLQSKIGATLLVHGCGPAQRVLLVRMEGEPVSTGLTQRQFNDAIRQALRLALTTSAKEAICFLAEVPIKGIAKDQLAYASTRQLILAARELRYRADQWKGKREPDTATLKALVIATDEASAKAAKRGLDEALAIANGVELAKDLGNAPGNVCTPSYLADTARRMGRSHKLKVQIFDEKKIRALGMGSFLAVAQGSHEPPRMIVLEYRGGPAKQAPVALVGKGITFDTGGISLKPGPEMDEMKFDMCGAASVLGTMLAVAELNLPINLVGVVVATENMPGGSAVKPGDIVKSMSGQTIEILNTDAEGRLILCDALTYVARYKPSTVIDIATLTGACVIALGGQHAGLFTTNAELSGALQSAGTSIGDTCWPMPLDDEYHDALKSNFADMANVGSRAAGAVTAACFLAKFAKGYDWAHLDIAGVAWKSGAAKGGTGRPVPLLTQYLINRSKA